MAIDPVQGEDDFERWHEVFVALTRAALAPAGPMLSLLGRDEGT